MRSGTIIIGRMNRNANKIKKTLFLININFTELGFNKVGTYSILRFFSGFKRIV